MIEVKTNKPKTNQEVNKNKNKSKAIKKSVFSLLCLAFTVGVVSVAVENSIIKKSNDQVSNESIASVKNVVDLINDKEKLLNYYNSTDYNSDMYHKDVDNFNEFKTLFISEFKNVNQKYSNDELDVIITNPNFERMVFKKWIDYNDLSNLKKVSNKQLLKQDQDYLKKIMDGKSSSSTLSNALFYYNPLYQDTNMKIKASLQFNNHNINKNNDYIKYKNEYVRREIMKPFSSAAKSRENYKDMNFYVYFITSSPKIGYDMLTHNSKNHFLNDVNYTDNSNNKKWNNYTEEEKSEIIKYSLSGFTDYYVSNTGKIYDAFKN